MSDRIVVSGYYGFANTGDEAILASVVEHLGRSGELVILSAHPRATRELYGVHAIGRTDLVAIAKALSGAALFISGGGGLLQDATGLKSVPYYSALLKAAQWRGVPTMLLGAGLGPLDSAFSRAVAGRALRACDVCAVR
ncbi:MAG: polysaccharide pyruvyl transferase family protein, partial [Cyanobacteria bacterium REEB65]|nr:polysaccharide pyruvyl transferase family protein [Cyanobacteria bacterium REEB65]